MQLIIITGPPAVGKMTVGRELEKLTGLPLFHNHMSIELVHRFFDFGTPAFRRLDRLIRFGVFREVATSDLPGLIFTYVWAYDDPDDHVYIDQIKELFAAHDASLCFVELSATQAERLRRNRLPDRLAEKPTKRDFERSEWALLQDDEAYRLNTVEGDFPEWDILRISNEELTATETARKIVEHYQLGSAS